MIKIFTNAEKTHTLTLDYNETAELITVVNFYAYQIAGVIMDDEGEETDVYIYDNDATDLTKVTPFAHGYVKWDGCMQIDLSQHLCGWDRSIDYLLRDIYLQAALVLGEFNFPNMAALRAHYNIAP